VETSLVRIFFASDGRHQGDQIGPIFASKVIDYFGQFLENYKSSPTCWATFLQAKSYVLILIKDELGFILGDFSETHLVTLVATHKAGFEMRQKVPFFQLFVVQAFRDRTHECFDLLIS
jgi:hypothetical protein